MMRSVVVLFALCLVTANAADTIIQPPLDYEAKIDDVVKEMEQIAKDASVALQNTIEEIVWDPLNQVEETVNTIESLRQENEFCVSAVDEKVAHVIDTMHKDLATCGAEAVKSAVDIMTDISAATQQLIFGGRDIIVGYRKCQRYTIPALEKICITRWYIKFEFYLYNANKSIKTIRESTTERIPAVGTDAYACTCSAIENAISELNNILASIGACIGKN